MLITLKLRFFNQATGVLLVTGFLTKKPVYERLSSTLRKERAKMEELQHQLAAALSCNAVLEAENRLIRDQNAQLHTDQVALRQTITKLESTVRASTNKLESTVRASARQTKAKLDQLLDAHRDSKQALMEQIQTLRQELIANTRKRTLDPRSTTKVHGIAVVVLPDHPTCRIIRYIAGQRDYVTRQIKKFCPTDAARDERLLLDFTETANPIDMRNNFVRVGNQATIEARRLNVSCSFVLTRHKLSY